MRMCAVFWGAGAENCLGLFDFGENVGLQLSFFFFIGVVFSTRVRANVTLSVFRS